MIEKITFDKSHELTYMGRNGMGKMVGIEVMTGEKNVYLTPINSRGYSANCELQIPYDSIDEIINALQQAKKGEDVHE